jgi:hypothetical protein
MALSSAPLFLAKLPVGLLSGVLLQKYCPETLDEENGEVRHSKTMWLIIGLSTICSPILITLLWGYLSGGDRAIASRRSSDDNDTFTNIEMEYPDEKRILFQQIGHSRMSYDAILRYRVHTSNLLRGKGNGKVLKSKGYCLSWLEPARY